MKIKHGQTKTYAVFGDFYNTLETHLSDEQRTRYVGRDVATMSLLKCCMEYMKYNVDKKDCTLECLYALIKCAIITNKNQPDDFSTMIEKCLSNNMLLCVEYYNIFKLKANEKVQRNKSVANALMELIEFARKIGIEIDFSTKFTSLV